MISTYKVKTVAPICWYAFDYLTVPLPAKLMGLKVIAELYTADGVFIKSERGNGPFLSMYTDDLPAGIYQLRIYWRDGTIAYKVIKNYTR